MESPPIPLYKHGVFMLVVNWTVATILQTIHQQTESNFILTVRKSFSNLYAPPPVAQRVVCRLEKFLSRPIWIKSGMACVGKRMKCRLPVRPHMVMFLSSRWTSRTPVLPVRQTVIVDKFRHSLIFQWQ